MSPSSLSELLMREQFDEPSPFEVWCCRALGLSEEQLAADSGLIDYVAAEQQRLAEGGAPSEEGFVPSPDFYHRLEALLEAEYGPLRV